MPTIRSLLSPLLFTFTLAACGAPPDSPAEDFEVVETEALGPAPDGDVIANTWKLNNTQYVDALPPQSLTCLKPVNQVGCAVARVYYGYAHLTPDQLTAAESDYGSSDLTKNRRLVVGHLATVKVTDHTTGTVSYQSWFMVDKLYAVPFRGRVYENHASQYFYATGTTSDAQVIAISAGQTTARAARITWTGLATYLVTPPTKVDDMFITGQADFSRTPLRLTGDEYFVRQVAP